MSSKKQMSVIFGSRHETDRWIFKVLTNGSQYYVEKHDRKMKKLYDTGKIKEYMPTAEIFRLKKEAEKAKRNQNFRVTRPQDIEYKKK